MADQLGFEMAAQRYKRFVCAVCDSVTNEKLTPSEKYKLMVEIAHETLTEGRKSEHRFNIKVQEPKDLE